jgi:hypothetical protein
MNAFSNHALADNRHGERYNRRGTAAHGAPSRRSRTAVIAARRRLGVLLVEAGLNLMARSEPAPRVTSRFV